MDESKMIDGRKSKGPSKAPGEKAALTKDLMERAPTESKAAHSCRRGKRASMGAWERQEEESCCPQKGCANGTE